jgi:succinate dehydrogenase / fumarate reductase cytochrome b subunit
VVITQQRNVVTRTWGSSVGKKAVMAVTGIVMLLFIIAHMLGNLKIYFGLESFNAYSEHLRAIGAEIVGESGVLWILRVVLVASVVLHIAAATSLARKAHRARPVQYYNKGVREGSYAARTMRWGGIIIALFIIWHILDLTTGTVNPLGQTQDVYSKLIASFDRWYVSIFYILAVVVLGLHIAHGLWSSIQTLGGNSAVRQNSLKAMSFAVAGVITVGFLVVPLSVMFGLVR